jgi:hypothetical protein
MPPSSPVPVGLSGYTSAAGVWGIAGTGRDALGTREETPVTLREVSAAILRRWYVLAAAVIVAVVAGVPMVRDGGIYTTRTVVLFINLGANQFSLAPDNGSANDNIIAFAGAVANDVNNGRPVMRYAHDDAPLYGAGMREGVFVGLPDDGGQWTTSYTRAELEIEIVGRSRESVEQTRRDLLGKVYVRARQLQGFGYNDPDRRIRTEITPLSLTIDHIEASRSQQAIAVAALGLAALIVGGWLAVRLDSALRARHLQGRSRAHTNASGVIQ